MSPQTSYATLKDYSFPRVSGDEPSLEEDETAIDEFSPRERG